MLNDATVLCEELKVIVFLVEHKELRELNWNRCTAHDEDRRVFDISNNLKQLM